MPFTHAVGLGVAIIVLKLLTPELFAEIHTTAVMFLDGAQVSARAATDLAASAGHIEFNNRPPILPQAPQIRSR